MSAHNNILRLAVAACGALWAFGAQAQDICRTLAFEGARHTVCEVDLRRHRLGFVLADGTDTPYGSLAAFGRTDAAAGALFAMNGGMYHHDLAPVGLYVQDGVERKALSTRGGPGNFHLKPNGVFYVTKDGAGVLETAAYARQKPAAIHATQSGPMLVIDGRLHPRFLADSNSLKIRNGVGIRDQHTVVFAISEDRVNFHAFARLFRDGLGCRNALYLDGTISSLYRPGRARFDNIFPAGPIIVAYER